jgi:hypothetical protein
MEGWLTRWAAFDVVLVHREDRKEEKQVSDVKQEAGITIHDRDSRRGLR